MHLWLASLFLLSRRTQGLFLQSQAPPFQLPSPLEHLFSPPLFLNQPLLLLFEFFLHFRFELLSKNLNFKRDALNQSLYKTNNYLHIQPWVLLAQEGSVRGHPSVARRLINEVEQVGCSIAFFPLLFKKLNETLAFGVSVQPVLHYLVVVLFLVLHHLRKFVLLHPFLPALINDYSFIILINSQISVDSLQNKKINSS